MRDLGHQGVKAVLSLMRRLWNRIVHDITADSRDLRQWGEQNIPPAVALVTEKWLGFWYAFIGTFLIGLLGIVLVNVAEWASSQPILAASLPRPILVVGGIGFFVVLLWGITLSALIIVSVIRALFWVRDQWKDYWNRNTPPYTDTDTTRETRPWPPTNKEKKEAKTKSWEYFKKGAFWFPLITLVLLQIELAFSNQIYPAIRNANWAEATDIVNATVGFVDIRGLAEAAGISLDPVQFIGFILIFVLPGILLSLSTRNLLLLTEAGVRESIEKASKGSAFEWRRIWLFIQFVVSALYAIVALYAAVYGI